MHKQSYILLCWLTVARQQRTETTNRQRPDPLHQSSWPIVPSVLPARPSSKTHYLPGVQIAGQVNVASYHQAGTCTSLGCQLCRNPMAVVMLVVWNPHGPRTFSHVGWLERLASLQRMLRRSHPLCDCICPIMRRNLQGSAQVVDGASKTSRARIRLIFSDLMWLPIPDWKLLANMHSRQHEHKLYQISMNHTTIL